MVHAIETELCKALDTKRKVAESNKKFVARLHEAAMEASEGDEGEKFWDQLSEGTQAWLNACTEALKADEDLPTYGDVDGGEEAPAKSKPTAAKAAKANGDAKPAKAAKDPKPAKEPRDPKTGKLWILMEAILENPEGDTEALQKAITKRGVEVKDSTVVTVRSDFMRSVRFLEDAGLLKSNPFA